MTMEVAAIILSCIALSVALFAIGCVLHKVGTKVENELCTRLRSLVADMIMLMIGCFLVCLVVFGCVHMFRLWDTGRLLIMAVSRCSAFLSAAVWPLMILLLVIIYRKHVVNALEKVPKFIENYHATDKVTAAESSDAAEDSEKEHTTTMSLIKKGSQDIVEESRKHPIGICQSDVGMAFMDYVLTKLQRELKEPICRDVNLFSNRFVRFDGAVVRGSRITGIEVCYNLNALEKKLQLYEKFYRSISENDQKHFDLMFCVRGNDSTQCSIENLRGKISFPVEFRCFQYEPEGQKCISIESKKKRDSMMTKKEIARQNGYDLSDEEIAVLCFVWTNTPKNSLPGVYSYVDLSTPTEEMPDSFYTINFAMNLDREGLLEYGKEGVNRFRLTEAGEALIKAFYS